MNDEERIDFESLDPTADPARFDELVRAVRDHAADELARRQGRWTVIGQIARWQRPLLAAAAVTAIISGAVLWQTRNGQSGSESATEVAEVLGVPGALATWVQGEGTPTVGQLLVTLGEDQ